MFHESFYKYLSKFVDYDYIGTYFEKINSVDLYTYILIQVTYIYKM